MDAAAPGAPIGAEQNKKTICIDKCFCFWPNCEELHSEALQKLPVDHPWCQRILQIQQGMTTKVLAL
jgi:hypothetical protein